MQLKAELKLSNRQLNSLVYSFNMITNLPVSDREQRVARSVLDKTVLRFRKKYLEVQQTAPTFSKKKYKFTLEYHEAHHLEQFILIAEQTAMNEYDHNVMHFIKSTLNQQLA